MSTLLLRCCVLKSCPTKPAQPTCTLLGTPEGLLLANLPQNHTRWTDLADVSWCAVSEQSDSARADVVGEESFLAHRDQLLFVLGLMVCTHLVNPDPQPQTPTGNSQPAQVSHPPWRRLTCC